MVKDLHEDEDPGEEKRFKSNPFKIKLRENGNILFSGNLSKIGNQKMDEPNPSKKLQVKDIKTKRMRLKINL